MQEGGFNSFASNRIKLSVNETEWSSLLARTRARILYISIWKFDFGPERLPGLSRNGPQGGRINTVDQIKIKIKTVQKIKFGIWEMKGGKYTKTFAKIQVRRIFRIRDIRRNVLPKFIEICMETPCCAHPPGWAPWRTKTKRNICCRALVQKREFIPRGTHKVILFLIHELFT